jgi:hypothetical protein
MAEAMALAGPSTTCTIARPWHCPHDILQLQRMQELWNHRSFHIDVKGKLGRSSSVWQVQRYCEQSLIGQCVEL